MTPEQEAREAATHRYYLRDGTVRRESLDPLTVWDPNTDPNPIRERFPIWEAAFAAMVVAALMMLALADIWTRAAGGNR